MRLREFVGSKFLFHEKPADEPFILNESEEKTHRKFYDIYGKKESVKISSSESPASFLSLYSSS